MSQLLERLVRTGPRELGSRGVEALRVAAEAVHLTLPGATRWRRHAPRLSAQSAELLLAREALAGGERKRAEFALRAHFLTRERRFLIAPAGRREFSAAALARFPTCADDAVRRAEPLLEGRYDLLGYTGLSFRSRAATLDWHFDPVHHRRAPVRFWARVPYLDPASGDHKIIWELNRHQHWLALGRAAWLTGDPRYAAAWAAELESWLAANPPLTGINWASMLELAFRSLSWTWALHLFVSFDVAPDSCWLLDLLTGIERQLEHVSHHLSTYFSPNTHLLGEALALYVAGRVLPELQAASRWERRGRDILLGEIRRQVHPDGGHAELSLHYHRYALDFYLLALTVARRTGDTAARPFAEVVSRLATFCRALADDTGRLATIGDDDGGMLLPICGREPADARDSLCLAAALLGDGELAVGEPPEEVLWMLGGDAAALVSPRTRRRRTERFPDTGYVVLRSAHDHAILDAGPHGFMNGGHAHADALSLVLSVGGHALLIDPGTATYTIDPELRDRFRSTAMHNTAVVDGRAQSDPAGPFHWTSRADAQITFWRPAAREAGCWQATHATGALRPPPYRRPTVDVVEAEHDGYLPVVHRRGVLRLEEGLWVVADHVLGDGDHRIDLHWHLAPTWTAGADGQFTHADGLHAAIVSTAPVRRDFHGDREGLGWSAPVYGRVIPSPALQVSDAGGAPLTIVTAVVTSTSRTRVSLARAEVTVDRDDGWHRAAVRLTVDDVSWAVAFATPPAASGTQHVAGDRTTGPERALHHVTLAGGVLTTDARVAALRVADTGAPCSLVLIDGSEAAWTGRPPFTVAPLGTRQDVQLDAVGLQALGRTRT